MIKVGFHAGTERSATRHFPLVPLCYFKHTPRQEGNWRKPGKMRKTVVEQKHSGTEKLLPLGEAKSHKAVHASFTIAITQQCSLLFSHSYAEGMRYR